MRGLHGGAEITCQVRKHRTLRSWVQERKYDYLLWIMFFVFCFLFFSSTLHTVKIIRRILNKTMWIWVYMYIWVCRWIYLCVWVYNHTFQKGKIDIHLIFFYPLTIFILSLFSFSFISPKTCYKRFVHLCSYGHKNSAQV